MKWIVSFKKDQAKCLLMMMIKRLDEDWCLCGINSWEDGMKRARQKYDLPNDDFMGDRTAPNSPSMPNMADSTHVTPPFLYLFPLLPFSPSSPPPFPLIHGRRGAPVAEEEGRCNITAQIKPA